MKKILFLLIIPILFLSSCANSDDPDLGRYHCRVLVSDGEALETDSIFSEANILELKARGKAVISLNGIQSEGRWERADNTFRLLIGDSVSVGTLENGVCTVDLFEKGLSYCFCKEDADINNIVRFSDNRPRNNKWSGDWYGYWCIFDSTGKWESLDRQRFDSFAQIDMGLDGLGRLILWDEKTSRELPVADVKLRLYPGDENEYGTAISESGYFFERNIEEGEWVISPDEQPVPNLLVIFSDYQSADGSFSYIIFLRPWGYVWDDLGEDSPIELPYYYSSFYVPSISKKPDQK